MAEYSINDKYAPDAPLSPTRDLEPLIEKNSIGIRATKLRWLALGLACFTSVGSYFCFDNPQALQDALHANLNTTSFQFNLLYSVYSLPNIILPLFGGVIIDRVGVRIAVSLFPFLLIIGQAIITFGAARKEFTLMLIGRVFFGLGGECLGVAQSSIVAKWFMGGKELSFALGATLCIARLGSSLNSFLSPKIYVWTGELYAPFLVGAILCVGSWTTGMILGFVDKKADDQEGTVSKGDAETEKINIKDLSKLSRLYFLLLFNCFFLYGAFFGMNNNLNDLMVKRFGFTAIQAGDYIPIIYICSAVITPLFGTFTDRKGKRVLFMLIASCLFFIDHLATAFLPDTQPGHPNYAMIAVLLGIGLFYATYAAIFWPCVPIVVKENMTGTAYGIISCLQNLMLSIIPMVLGAIKDGTSGYKQGYFWTEITLAGLVVFGIAITSWMYFEDMKKGGKLNRPGTEREKASGLKSQARSFVRA